MPIPFIAPDDDYTPFPDVGDALREPNGLLMAGGSLSERRLVKAYSNGIFPWYEEGEPILWWSPDPRCIILPSKIKVSRSLSKTIRSRRYEVTENLAYREVMKQCGAPRPGSTGTWVTENMIKAYCRLNTLGIARSLEVWEGHRLVGGLYGIDLGQVFVGESMFSRASDASKMALVHLATCGRYEVIDCQLETQHLRSLGAESISRREYLSILKTHGQTPNELLPALFGAPPNDQKKPANSSA
jgi:leucyl/phenylalanyl-tRNA---protein transferase